MVARTNRQSAEDEGRGKRQRPGKPATTPDQSGDELTTDLAPDNGNKSSDGLYRDGNLIPGESRSAKRPGRKGQGQAQGDGGVVSTIRETPTRPERCFLTIHQVCKITSLCSSSVYAMLNRGQFPLPLVLGERRRRWDSNDVYDWMDSRPRGRGYLGKWIDPTQAA